MSMFLYARMGASPKEETKNIPFEPQVWYSAARNINREQYETQQPPLEHSGLSFGGTENAPV